MKPIFLVTALAGVASAHAHAHLARQVDDVSDECIEAQNAIFSANYPTPTLLSSLSRDYYATATPTATHGEVDCGWVTAIPKSSYADVAEKLDEHYLWEQSSSNMDILSDIADNCDFGTDADGPDPSVPVCVKEWNALVDRISAETGWEPAFGPDYLGLGADDADADDADDVDDADAEETSTAIPDECREASEAISSANYPYPTVVIDFSSSYYETATRTAPHTLLDCAYVTAIPESSYDAIAKLLDDQALWVAVPGNVDLMFDLCDSGVDLSAFDIPDSELTICGKEWGVLVADIVEKTGWEPIEPDMVGGGGDGDDAKDEDADKPSMASADFQVSALAAFLATLLGAVALL